MNNCKTLYIIGYFSLPGKTAGALRILGLCDGFKDYFEKIIIAGRADCTLHTLSKYDDKISFLPYHKCSFDNFADKFKTNFFFSKYIIDDLLFAIKTQNVSHILIYSAINIRVVKKIKKIAKKYNLKLIFDVVEFQTLSAQSIASYFTFYRPNIYINKHAINKSNSVITISSYLRDFFSSKEITSIMIPFVFGKQCFQNDFRISNREHSCLKLIYAGNGQKGKDLLSNCIEGMNLLSDADKKQVTLDIYGLTKREAIKNHTISKKLANKTSLNVNFMGEKSHEEMAEIFKQYDFSILLRPSNSRLSNAGFPTKVAESLCYGVPIISNITSDLDTILVDEFNSLISNSENPVDFKNALIKAIRKNDKEITNMKINARKTAEERLTISLYTDKIKTIL